MKHVLVVAGTRPELIKLGPVVREMKAHPGLKVTYVLTGQHYDELMAGASIWQANPSWPQPDGVTDEYMDGIDAVLVQGDTNSAQAGAIWAVTNHIPLIHLEAGLRCFDTSVPEEQIRVWIDERADLLLTPSHLATAFAQRDAKVGSVIIPIGQTGLEAFAEVSRSVARQHLAEPTA